jgi:bacterioferritin-associated ferredoxin
MTAGRASDEVIDAIAQIEIQRQEMEKDSGVAAACSEALRKLHELLGREQAAPQPHDPGAGYLANTEVVMIDIKRVQKLAGVTGKGALSKNPRPGQHQVSMRSGTRNPARNKGRRTMGRRGDR